MPCIIIANYHESHIIDWSVYLSPFSTKVWLIIIASAIIVTIVIIIMDIQYNGGNVSYNFIAKKQLFSILTIVEHITINSHGFPCIIIGKFWGCTFSFKNGQTEFIQTDYIYCFIIWSNNMDILSSICNLKISHKIRKTPI